MAVRIMGEDFVMGLTLLSALPYSGALVAVCMTMHTGGGCPLHVLRIWEG